MKISRTAVILALFLPAMTLSGCSGENKNISASSSTADSNSFFENANSAKTNIEELSLLVNLPYVPEDDDVVWKADTALKKLTAVLRFSPADADRFVAEASRHGTPQNTTLSSETWFPPELIAQSDMSGDDSLRGIAYAADSFFQAPYTSGRIVRIDRTDFFILELSVN